MYVNALFSCSACWCFKDGNYFLLDCVYYYSFLNSLRSQMCDLLSIAVTIKKCALRSRSILVHILIFRWASEENVAVFFWKEPQVTLLKYMSRFAFLIKSVLSLHFPRFLRSHQNTFRIEWVTVPSASLIPFTSCLTVHGCWNLCVCALNIGWSFKVSAT